MTTHNSDDVKMDVDPSIDKSIKIHPVSRVYVYFTILVFHSYFWNDTLLTVFFFFFYHDVHYLKKKYNLVGND